MSETLCRHGRKFLYPQGEGEYLGEDHQADAQKIPQRDTMNICRSDEQSVIRRMFDFVG
jgi:hypothetical protein